MKSKDKYYFSHDSNALSDPKILIMRADYGLEGYGLFWALLEMMRNEVDYRLDYTNNSFRAIKSLTNTKIDVGEYINNCINDYQLFVLDEENKKFYSESFLRRMEEYERKVAVKRANGKLGGRPKKTETKPIGYENKPIGYETETNSYENETEKNQIKLNKTKLNINTKLNYTKLNYIFNLIITENVRELELSESNFAGFKFFLKKLDLIITQNFFKLLSQKQVLEYKVIYYSLLELWKSSFVVFLPKLTREELFHKLYKTEENLVSLDEITEEDIEGFISYFITCLQNILNGSDANAKI